MTDETAAEVATLAELLERLREADPGFRVAGSERHRYRLGPALAEAELAAFEADHGARLPEDFRLFLADVGNGGAGPFYGLEPLGAHGRDLSRPFPFTESTESLTEDELDAIPGPHPDPGVLKLCDQGCGIHSYLVVNGPAYGSVWDGREDWYPTGRPFAGWYRRWLDRALRALANERLVPRLRVGMSRAEVLAVTGEEWSERPAAGRPVRYLEAADVSAQLELDERDVVVKVTPWETILASPS